MDLPLTLPGADPWHEVMLRAAYRTVQEGLTDARKHAPGAPIRVHLHDEDGHLYVEIRDSPPTAPPLDLAPGGHGLVDLRERAHLPNGTLRMSHECDRGFLLHAAFPTSKRSRV
ncbi:sensor histidine kinase [Streptomyces sp. NBC_00648]|uniref:sensor histidine kinase n=1 Tax=Streptomyces sp. NBC_00648 TaxID=2975797 RepID=UPI00324FBF26